MASSMAKNHRKLFPTSPTNQTLNCPDICDPKCPYDCFPYPDFYFIPPPPPPPRPATTGHHISPYIIIIITLFASFFLLVFYYAIFVKSCLRRHHRSTPPPAAEDFLDENRGPTIDNPIWYITTVGLQQSVINSITTVKYSKASGLIDGTDCSVCLNEFQEDETLRLLPKCNHAFHLHCIDTWLRSHTNCPMCRCGILSNTESNSQCGMSSNTNDHINSNDLGSNQETRMEIPDPDQELGMNQAEEETEIHQIDDETKDNEFWVVDISADNDVEDRIQIQRVKRSFSMDFGSSVNSRVFRMMGGSSISKSLHKRPVSMKRSFSYSGRSFLWRHYRNHKAVIRIRNFC
ncbi:hypothetical protein LguiA_004121 [Lonicera macranthoides]